MTELAMELLFCFAVIISLGMFSVFLLCMYLKEFPKIKHKSETDLIKNIYKTETEIDKTTKKK